MKKKLPKKKSTKKVFETNLLGRNTRSTEVNVCSFYNHGFAGRKMDTPWPRKHLPENLPFLLLPVPSLGFFLRWDYVEKSHPHLENIPLKASAQTPNQLPPQPQIEGPWNARKSTLLGPLSQERFRNNKLLHGGQILSLSFPVFRELPFPQMPPNSATAWKIKVALTCPHQIHVKQTVISPWTKGWTQLSEIYSWPFILNPGLTLGSPGVLN